MVMFHFRTTKSRAWLRSRSRASLDVTQAKGIFLLGLGAALTGLLIGFALSTVG